MEKKVKKMANDDLIKKLSELAQSDPEAAKAFLEEQGVSLEENKKVTEVDLGEYSLDFWDRKADIVARDLCGSIMNVYQDKKVIARGRFSEVLSWDSVPLEKGGDRNRFGELNQCAPGEIFPYRMYGGFGFGISVGGSEQPYGLVVIRKAFRLEGPETKKHRLVSATKVLGHYGIDHGSKGEQLVIPERRLLVPPSNDVRSLIKEVENPHKGKYAEFGVRGYELTKVC